MRDSQWKKSPTCFLFKNSIQAVLHTLRESIHVELYETWKSVLLGPVLGPRVCFDDLGGNRSERMHAAWTSGWEKEAGCLTCASFAPAAREPSLTDRRALLRTDAALSCPRRAMEARVRAGMIVTASKRAKRGLRVPLTLISTLARFGPIWLPGL